MFFLCLGGGAGFCCSDGALIRPLRGHLTGSVICQIDKVVTKEAKAKWVLTHPVPSITTGSFPDDTEPPATLALVIKKAHPKKFAFPFFSPFMFLLIKKEHDE